MNYTRSLRIALRHPLILDGLSFARRYALRRTGTVEQSACTFYLVFKEPDFVACVPLRVLFPSGEPSNTSEGYQPCQPLFPSFSRGRFFAFRRRDIVSPFGQSRMSRT